MDEPTRIAWRRPQPSVIVRSGREVGSVKEGGVHGTLRRQATPLACVAAPGVCGGSADA